jgi:hypothetical protein
LLFWFGIAAFRAFGFAFLVFSNRQDDREFFVAGLAKIFVLGHELLLLSSETLPRAQTRLILEELACTALAAYA